MRSSSTGTFGRFAAKYAKAALERGVLSVVNGVSYVVDGAAKPTLGSTPKEVVYANGKVTLWRMKPLGSERVELGADEFEVEMAVKHPVPVLLIPPFMVRPYVYDLRPDHSMVRTLRNAGFDVFLLDFGVPGPADEGLRLDDYVLDFVPNAIERALEVSGAEGISLCGYCMGGIFALVHQAMFHDPRVKSIVAIGAPVNFEKMGMLTAAARLGMLNIPQPRGLESARVPVVDALLDVMGNFPGFLASSGFRMLGGTRAITKYLGLLANLYDEEYVRGFDAIDTWLSEMVPFPKEALRQTIKEVVHGNKMLKNELSFGGRAADLHAVDVPVLAFAGRGDTIATPASTAAILELLGTADTTYREVAGGHIGVLAGSSAPADVWHPMIEWLRAKHAAPRARAKAGDAKALPPTAA